jgi:quercetin dioxygenase-like cupin family protein
MARPHVCFVQAQSLPWQRGLPGGARPEIESKTLSLDEADGAATAIVRYPAGWTSAKVEHLAADEEFFVLEGALFLNGRRYERHSYAYLPAGYGWRQAAAPEGAVLLSMFSRRPEVRSGAPTSFNAGALIDHVDSFKLPWKSGADGQVADRPLGRNIFSKILRRDERTGALSFLYCALPHHPPPAVMIGKWAHPGVEEIYTLEGEYVFGDLGVMGPGGYCWWREGEYHGPAGSEAGYLLFIRSVGGPLSNTFAREPSPFAWNPPYRPALPPALGPHAKPYVRAKNY